MGAQKEGLYVCHLTSAKLRAALVWRIDLARRRLGADDWSAHLCVDSDAFRAGNQSHDDRRASPEPALWRGGWRLCGPLEPPAHHGRGRCVVCALALAFAVRDLC